MGKYYSLESGRFMRLTFSVQGDDVEKLINEIVDSSLFAGKLPTEIRVDNEPYKVEQRWIHNTLEKHKIMINADWDDRWHYISYYGEDVIKVSVPEFNGNAHSVLELLAPLSWTLISFSTLHKKWYAKEKNYFGCPFESGHFHLGWGCAFKGKGHDQLTGRRWLVQGPWLNIRGDHDTTLIQFHDLNADIDTAFEQANAAHERMSSRDIGGFIFADYEYEYNSKGLYSETDHKLRIIVVDREVSQREMLDARALVVRQDAGVDTPLDNVAFIFLDYKHGEAAARKHLHKLWLHGLECWTIIDGREVRLDLDYRPAPVKPEWVQRLLAEENNQQ
jgi:hypothetical protein